MPAVRLGVSRRPAAARQLPFPPAIAWAPSSLWAQGCCCVHCYLHLDLHRINNLRQLQALLLMIIPGVWTPSKGAKWANALITDIQL